MLLVVARYVALTAQESSSGFYKLEPAFTNDGAMTGVWYDPKGRVRNGFGHLGRNFHGIKRVAVALNDHGARPRGKVGGGADNHHGLYALRLFGVTPPALMPTPLIKGADAKIIEQSEKIESSVLVTKGRGQNAGTAMASPGSFQSPNAKGPTPNAT